MNYSYGVASQITRQWKRFVSGAATVRSFLATEFRRLLSDLDFGDAILGYLSITPDSSGRCEEILQRLTTITQEHPRHHAPGYRRQPEAGQKNRLTDSLRGATIKL
jgi:hypothetical protein